MWDETARQRLRPQCGTRTWVGSFRRWPAVVAAVLGGLMGPAPSAYAAALSPISKGPYLQELGPTSVVVRVEVDPPAAVDVEVSPVGLDAAGPVSVKHDPAA